MNPVAGRGAVVGLGVPAFLAALFCFTELPAQQQGEAKVTAVRNQVTKIAEGTNAPADVGHALRSGEVLETGEQGLVELKSTDATTVRVGERSRVVYDPDDRTVKLDRGVVLVDASPDGGPVKINLGGATYTVTTEGEDRTRESQIRNTNTHKNSQPNKSNSVVSKPQEAVNPK
ncbi:MAG: hypothetical protein EB090_05930 [Verrucomicrobia bacterium]|nr:hypothetical protein [Verrucomicrobiota bacterium]